MNLLLSILRSYSQVFLQENAVLGALIIVGLAIASPLVLITSLIGALSSIGVALLLGVPKNLIESGLYGFNGVLIGVAAAVFVKQLPAAAIVAIIASVLGTLLFYVLTKNNISPLSTPFVLMGWIIILAVKYFK